MDWKIWFTFGQVDGVVKGILLASILIVLGVVFAPILTEIVKEMWGIDISWAMAIGAVVVIVVLLGVVTPILAILIGLWYAFNAILLNYLGIHSRGFNAVIKLIIFANVLWFSINQLIKLITTSAHSLSTTMIISPLASFLIGIIYSIISAIIAFYVWTKVMHRSGDELYY